VQSDGKSYEMDYNSSWGTILNKHIQFRCKICPDGTGEFADIVCADAWYGKDGYPDFTERDGRSLILTRSTFGEALVNEALLAKVIEIENLDVKEISKMQPYQLSRKQVVLGRVMAAGLANKKLVSYKNMGLIKASFSINPITLLMHALGTYKRTKGEIQ
jgi:coenzyme F420 hydrogenase subunit beta